MDLHTHSMHRPIDAEARLLRFAGAVPHETGPTPKLSERVASGVAEWTKWIVDIVGDTGKGILKGLQDGWNADTRIEDQKLKEMQMISESLKLMPQSMRQFLEARFLADEERLTLLQLAPLFQLDTWSRAFETKDIFDPAKEPVVPFKTLKDGPLGIVRSLDVTDRKEMFYDFFRSLVPPEVGEARDYHDDETKNAVAAYHRMVDGPDDASRLKFLLDDPANVQRAQAAMGGVLGRPDMLPTEVGNPDAYLVSRAALRQHYWRDGVRAVGAERLPIQRDPIVRTIPGGTEATGYGAKPRLFDDVAKAIGVGTRGADSAKLERSLPPSLLKGALTMNMLNQVDLQDIEVVLGKRDAEASKAVMDARSQYLDLSGAVRAEKAREAMDFAKIFKSLSGFEKLALIGAGIYLVTQMPGLTVGGAVLYFGSKFLNKQKDPINDVLAPMVQGGTKMVNDVVEYVSGGAINLRKGEFDTAEAGKRVDLMQQFLGKNALRDLDSSVTGFSILGDMNLQQLQLSLVLGSDDGVAPLNAALDTRTPAFSFLRTRLKEKGLRAGAQNFFLDGPTLSVLDEELTARMGTDQINENLLAAGNALMVVYYLVAARKPENRDMVRRLEKLRADADGKYESLPPGRVTVDGVELNAREEFMKLVRQGMREAPNQTLAEFVRESLEKDALMAPRVDPTVAPVTPVLPGVDPGAAPVLPGVAPGVAPAAPGVDPGAAPVLPGVDPGVAPVGPGADPGALPVRPGVDPGVAPRAPGVDPGAPAVRPAADPGAPAVGPARDPGSPATKPATGRGAPAAAPAKDPGAPAIRFGTLRPATTPSPAPDPGDSSSGPSSSPGTGRRRPTPDTGK